MTTHEPFEELAVGHALNALEPEDEIAFLAHLPSCAACERAVAEHRETLGHLAYATAAEEPPTALLDGIRAGIAASGRAGTFPAPASLAAARERKQSRTVKLTTALVGVAASFVLLAALVLSNVGLRSTNSDLAGREAAFQRTVNSLVTPGAKTIQLTGDGTAVAVVQGNNVDLVMRNVPANDVKTSTYVLWQQNAKGISGAGTFDVGSTGLLVVHKGLTITGDGLQRLMVTREVGRQAPASPAGPLVFTGIA